MSVKEYMTRLFGAVFGVLLLASTFAAGDTGVASTDLRPAGRGEFGGKLFDVKSVGSFIDAGSPIRVVSAGRFVIEVEEADE